MNSTWDASWDFKLMQTRGSWIKSTKPGVFDGQLGLSSGGLSNTNSSLRSDLDRLLPFKGTTAEVLNQGSIPDHLSPHGGCLLLSPIFA